MLVHTNNRRSVVDRSLSLDTVTDICNSSSIMPPLKTIDTGVGSPILERPELRQVAAELPADEPLPNPAGIPFTP
jgi:hypothetical protein